MYIFFFQVLNATLKHPMWVTERKDNKHRMILQKTEINFTTDWQLWKSNNDTIRKKPLKQLELRLLKISKLWIYIHNFTTVMTQVLHMEQTN